MEIISNIILSQLPCNMLLFYLKSSSYSAVPQPETWLEVIVWTSTGFQIIIALIIMISYAFNAPFRKKPGSIILGYAISAFFLSILWAFNFNEYIAHSKACQVIGAMSIFFENNCIFYEIAFIYYFVCYFKNEQDSEDEASATDLIESEVKILKGSDRQDIPILKLQAEQSLFSEEDLKKEESLVIKEIKEKCNNLSRDNYQLAEYCQIVAEDSRTMKQELAEMKQSFKKLAEKQKENSPYSLTYIQAKMNCFVFILSVTLTLMPALFSELGIDFYGACSKEEKAETTQDNGVIFCLVVSAFNAFASSFGLIYFHEQRNKRQRRLEGRDLSPQEKEQEHYLKHIYVFIIVTMLCNWTFSATNIYADLYQQSQDGNKNQEEEDHWWESPAWKVLSIIHFLMLAIQGFALLSLKMSEPLTKEATNETIGRVKRWLKRCKCCKRTQGERDEARISLVRNDVHNDI